MQDANGDILFCDLELALPDLSAARLGQLQDALIKLGAPKGTQFIDDDGQTLASFGDISVVGIGLDGTGLPESAYENFDPDTFNDQVVDALGDAYSFGGSHMGARYTFFYYHGPDSRHIEGILRQITAAMPIATGAQFEHLT